MTRPATIQVPPLDDPRMVRLRRWLKNHARGEAAAVTKPRLYAAAQARLGMQRRVVDEALRALRAAGYPVAATGKGVFWAISADELGRALHYVTSRHDDLVATAKAYRALIDAWGRVDLPEGGRVEADGQRCLFAAHGRT